jgi:predicted DNA-binding transcriptional regulator AlpA
MPTAILTLPETGFLRQPQVLAFVPISKSTLWRRIQARTFPDPVKLSERVTVWRAEDIRRWIAQQGRRSDFRINMGDWLEAASFAYRPGRYRSTGVRAYRLRSGALPSMAPSI